jgi:predicted ATPase
MRLRGHALVIGHRRLTLKQSSVEAFRQMLDHANTVVPLGYARSAVRRRLNDERQLIGDLTRANRLLGSAAGGAWYIAHFPGKGLMLTSEVRQAPAASATDDAEAGSLPDLPDRLVGREEVSRQLVEKFVEHRLVSIVGPGGMGKTSLAVVLARHLARNLPDGVHFIDLAKHASVETAARELAITLGIEQWAGDPLGSLAHWLRAKRMLILLDGCEAAIDAAAMLAEALASPGVLILATSREPLAAAGEWVHRIQPLPSPPASDALPAWLAETYPALQLFAKVAGATAGARRLRPQDIAIASGICRRLDGNPLAIRLAASRVESLGVQGVADQLDRKMLEWEAGAAEQPRHRSLEAVLDWSFQLLSPAQQAVFRALAPFRAQFDLDAASAVGGREDQDVASVVLDLVAKSLLMPQNQSGDVSYRLLDTTRAYAERALELSPPAEQAACRRRHASFLARLLVAAEREWDTSKGDSWRRKYSSWVEDVRAALGWAFSDAGDREAGVELAVASLALADQSGLMVDFGRFAGLALDELQTLLPRRQDLELKLSTFPVFNQLAGLNAKPDQLAQLERAVELGQTASSAQAQMGGILGLWSNCFQVGDYRGALEWTNRMRSLGETHADAVADLTARRTRAQVQHFLGDHAAARATALRICSQAQLKLPLAYTPSPVSLNVSMRILLARTHWIEGDVDQAWTVVDDCVRFAEDDPPISISQALGVAAIPLAFWCGRWDDCRRWIDRLEQLALRLSYEYWILWCGLYTALLDLADPAEPVPASVLEKMQPRSQTKFRDQAGTLRAAALNADTLGRVVRGEVGWCGPEVYRLEAERAMQIGSAAALGQARSLIDNALGLARTQGALAWELRAAMSGARLEQRLGEATGAAQVLASVRDRFRAGLDTPDLRLADHMLGRRPDRGRA